MPTESHWCPAAVVGLLSLDHGTSSERAKWFEVGYTTGSPDKCATVYDDLGNGTLAAELQAGADAVNSATDTTGTIDTTATTDTAG